MDPSDNNDDDDASIAKRELNGECDHREPDSLNSESIATWQLQEQPRYRLMHEGAEALANAELLAVCLGSGVAGEDAVAMARRLLKQFGGIGALLSAPMTELIKCYGVGSAKASVIKAIQELSLRDLEYELAHNHPSGSPEPSQADIHLTQRLVELLQQVDIRVLDHIVVAAGSCVSFARRGLL